ncbi:MAG: FlxA-like family protein [Vallitaleaceae bacterium]|jgi:biopolymer transport protein ExbB/TolQ|nr:FlxA-like family protein [Vallitaleaceae bacterium]
MAISGVTTTTSTTYVSGSTNTSEVAQLQKQLETLQKELVTISQSDDDVETKEQQSASIQTQIQLIQAKIQQIQTKQSDNEEKTSTELINSSISSDQVSQLKTGTNEDLLGQIVDESV